MFTLYVCVCVYLVSSCTSHRNAVGEVPDREPVDLNITKFMTNITKFMKNHKKNRPNVFFWSEGRGEVTRLNNSDQVNNRSRMVN